MNGSLSEDGIKPEWLVSRNSTLSMLSNLPRKSERIFPTSYRNMAVGFDYITKKNGIMLFRKPKRFKV
jgi:hypothetical protein